MTETGPDAGEPLTYHPPIPDPSTFDHRLVAMHDAAVRTDEPEVAFGDWHARTLDGAVPVLSVGKDQWAVLRWDFDRHAGAEADGAGLLALTTHAVAQGGGYETVYGQDLGMEFGKVRVVEILGGDPAWDVSEVTYRNLLQGEDASAVFNGQMIFDADVAEAGGTTYVTLSRPVMQRLLGGTTKGLLLRPLGALHASFYASETEHGPTLLFNTPE